MADNKITPRQLDRSYVDTGSFQTIDGYKAFIGTGIRVDDLIFVGNSTDKNGTIVFTNPNNDLSSQSDLKMNAYSGSLLLRNADQTGTEGLLISQSSNGSIDTVYFPKGGTVAFLDDIGGGGGGVFTGSIIDNQIAFGDGNNILGGSNDLLWDGTNMTVTGNINITDTISANTGSFIGATIAPTFTDFENRIAVGTPSYGGSRLGDSQIQASTYDVGTAVSFVSSSQQTQWAWFSNGVGNSMTIRHVQNPTALLSVQNNAPDVTYGVDDVESTIGLVTQYDSGDPHVYDLFNQYYVATGSALSHAQGINMIAPPGNHRKFGIYRTETGLTNLTVMMEITGSSLSSQIATWSIPVRGIAATDSNDFVIKSQLDDTQGSFISTSSDFSIIPADNKGYTVLTGANNTVTVNSSSLTNNGDFTIIDYVGSGTLTIVAGASVTLRYNAVRSLTASQYSVVTIKKIGISEYRVYGELDLA